jgi:hypothetical protein
MGEDGLAFMIHEFRTFGAKQRGVVRPEGGGVRCVSITHARVD